jgi:hypothetical protein
MQISMEEKIKASCRTKNMCWKSGKWIILLNLSTLFS